MGWSLQLAAVVDSTGSYHGKANRGLKRTRILSS